MERKIVGIHMFPSPHTCDTCHAEIARANVVMTLAGNRDNPAEYAWACPECGCLDSFTLVPEPDDDGDLESVRLAGRSVTLPNGNKIASADEIYRRIGKAKPMATNNKHSQDISLATAIAAIVCILLMTAIFWRSVGMWAGDPGDPGDRQRKAVQE